MKTLVKIIVTRLSWRSFYYVFCPLITGVLSHHFLGSVVLNVGELGFGLDDDVFLLSNVTVVLIRLLIEGVLFEWFHAFVVDL